MQYPDSLHPDIPYIKNKLKRGLDTLINWNISDDFEENCALMYTGFWIENTYADITSYPLVQLGTKEKNLTINEVNNSKYFAIVSEKITLQKEVGPSASRNGSIDAGEKIIVRVPLMNVYSRPLFSTSAFVSFPSSYTWSSLDKEIEIKELKPYEETYIEIPVYISKYVRDGTSIPIHINLYDSKYFSKNPTKVQFSIVVSNRGYPKLQQTVVERDMPGFSESNDSPEILPYQKVEVRTDVQINDNNISSALLDYQYNDLLSGVYEKTEMTKKK